MSITGHTTPEQQGIVPHTRTLRNVCSQVIQMVASGDSPRRIRSYLLRWCTWWVRTADCWTKHELLAWFLEVCWDRVATAVAASLLHTPINQAAFENLRWHDASSDLLQA